MVFNNLKANSLEHFGTELYRQIAGQTADFGAKGVER